jgi:peptidoglycan/LPS O-acetylase OafA/YrhL
MTAPTTPPAKPSAAISDHLPGLDGLRAIAIGSVFAFHLGLPGCSLGWAGVQLFFVISGFLITGILLRTRDRPRYFRNFYIRRTLRIFPIYYLVVAIYFTVAQLHGDGPTVRLLPYYLSYSQTYPQLVTHYQCAPLLTHTWTLAIEEQFYLLWPLSLFLLRGKWLSFALAVAIALGLGTRLSVHRLDNPFLLLGWLPTQIDLLAAGAMIAVLAARRPAAWMRRLGYLLAGSGLLVAGAMVARAGLQPFWSPLTWVPLAPSPYFPTAMAAFFAGVVTLTATESPLTRWLANRPMMRIGKISYGLYLFSPFTFAWVDNVTASLRRSGPPTPTGHLIEIGLIVAKLGATVLVAECSWRLFEGPINALKDRLTRKPAARPKGNAVDAGPAGGAAGSYDSSPPAST